MQAATVIDIMRILDPLISLGTILLIMYLAKTNQLLTKALNGILSVLGIDKEIPEFVNTAADIGGRAVLGKVGGRAVSDVLNAFALEEGLCKFPAFIKYVLALLGGHFAGNDVAFMEWLARNVPKEHPDAIFPNINKAQLEEIKDMKVILSEVEQRLEAKQMELEQKLKDETKKPPKEDTKPDTKKPPKEDPKGGKK